MLLLFHRRRGPAGKNSAARHHLHSDDPHLFLDGQRKKILPEAVVVLVGRVDTHQHGVKGKAMYAFDERFRTEAPGNAEMVYHFLVSCLNQGFDSAAFAKYLVSVFLNSNVVKLPGVDV